MSRRFYKRIISFILVCGMCIGINVVSISVAASTEKREPAYNFMEALRTLGFIPDYYDYNVNLDSPVTRADFSAAIAKIMKIEGYAENDIYFYDVPKTHWAHKEISALANSGIINGNGEKLFFPDRVITAPEAYKLMLTAMGHNIYAELKGGYPSGYIAAALLAEIDVPTYGELTNKDMFTILYNGMKANIFEGKVYGTNEVEYAVSPNKTLLAVHHNIYYGKGMLNGANSVSVYERSLEDGKALIDDTEYVVGNVQLENYIGQHIEFFYHCEKNSDKKTILWAIPTGKTEVLEITAERDTFFDAGTFEFEFKDSDSGKYRKVTVDRGITVIYNGGCVTEGVDEIFNLPEYTVKLIKNDGKYNVAIVKSYENIIVDKIDREKHIVYDRLNPSKFVELNPNLYEKMTLKMLGTPGADLSSITVDSVLSVYRSLDGRYIEVNISGNQMTGIIDSVKNEDDGYLIKIDSNKYYIPKNAVKTGIPVGRPLLLYMDANGKVAYIKELELSCSPTYLIAMIKYDEGFENAVEIKYLNFDGAVKTAKCADRVQLDGDKLDDVSEIYTKLGGNTGFTPQFAMIRIDANEEISIIDTVNNDKGGVNDVLSVNNPYKTQQEFRTFGAFGLMSFVNSGTVFFSVPSDDKVASAKDTEFGVLGMNQLVDGTKMNIESYKTVDRAGYEQYVVIKGYGTSNFVSTVDPVLVENIGVTLSPDGEVRESVTGYQGTNYVEYIASDDYSFESGGISDGDTIRIKINSKNEVEGAQILVDYSDIENSVTGAPEQSSSYTTSLGYAYDVVGDIVKISYNKNDLSDVGLIMSTASRTIIVYDEEARLEKVRVGSVEDIKTYYNNGVDCSKVFLVQGWTIPKVFVVYK